jgi:hypothetical protein
MKVSSRIAVNRTYETESLPQSSLQTGEFDTGWICERSILIRLRSQPQRVATFQAKREPQKISSAHLGGIFRRNPLGREFVPLDFVSTCIGDERSEGVCDLLVSKAIWRGQLWSWCVRSNEVTAVVVWRDNNDAWLRLCDRPLIRSYEGYLRYTPDADDTGAGMSALRVTDNLCDANEDTCDQDKFRGHMLPLAAVTFKWRDYSTIYSAAHVRCSKHWIANPTHRVTVHERSISERMLRELWIFGNRLPPLTRSVYILAPAGHHTV